jgi:hypothetical protein
MQRYLALGSYSLTSKVLKAFLELLEFKDPQALKDRRVILEFKDLLVAKDLAVADLSSTSMVIYPKQKSPKLKQLVLIGYF